MIVKEYKIGPGADLTFADLRDADLRDADLRGADLGGADLKDADLSGADLQGANLRGANLTEAYFKGADLTDATMPCGETASALVVRLAQIGACAEAILWVARAHPAASWRTLYEAAPEKWRVWVAESAPDLLKEIGVEE